MITRKNILLGAAAQIVLLCACLVPRISSLERVPRTPYPIKHKEGQRLQQSVDISGQKISIPKFGDAPTNRVLPVDHLTEADYEDIQDKEDSSGNGLVSREYCSRLMRLEFMNTLKSERRSRQVEDEETAGLLANYLDFDPVKVVGPLINVMRSAAERNATSVNENYNKLPSFFKSQVTDFIQVFNELLKSVGT